jgi:hypothetical protein
MKSVLVKYALYKKLGQMKSYYQCKYESKTILLFAFSYLKMKFFQIIQKSLIINNKKL